MVNPVALVIGPLLGPECARSARRGWVLVLRALGGAAFAAPAVVALWWWWMSASIDPAYRPEGLASGALLVMEVLGLAVALLLAPAALAGSLAGEKERGSIGLLLSTRVDAREIVLGRLFGKLSPIGAILLAGLPFLVGFAVLGDLGFGPTVLLIALPVVVAFGAGGLAIAASALARRGRNALVVVYLLELLLLLPPSLGRSLMVAGGPLATLGSALALLGPLDPFTGVLPLVFAGPVGPAVASLFVWAAVGAIGSAVASWRLRPAYLALVGGKARGGVRRGAIPAVDEARPMLWKELYIEKTSALGWFGRVVGAGLLLFLLLGAPLLAGLATWARAQSRSALARGDLGLADAFSDRYKFYATLMGRLYEDTGWIVSIVIQLAVGLRAAVAISSERERGTWDALLTSPLSGREILLGKLGGSLFGLRWLVGASLLAWGLTLAVGGMGWQEFVGLALLTAIPSAFIAALGVRISLSVGTATRSMALTVGLWAAAWLAIAALAGLTVLVVLLAGLLAWVLGQQVGLVALGGRPWVANRGGEVFVLAMAASFLAFTAQLVASARVGFDRIAGRLAGDGSDRPPAPRYLPTGKPDPMPELRNEPAAVAEA